jgi:hypothetical protein
MELIYFCIGCNSCFPVGQLLSDLCPKCQKAKEWDLTIQHVKARSEYRKNSIKCYCSICFQPIYDKYTGICKHCKQKMNRLQELAKMQKSMLNHGMVTTESRVVDSAIKKFIPHSEFIDSSVIEDKIARREKNHV